MEHDITLGTILEHLRAFETRVNERFNAIDRRFDCNESRIDRMERNLTRQIDAIDKRLDAIEIEHMPQRVLRLERHAGFATTAS